MPVSQRNFLPSSYYFDIMLLNLVVNLPLRPPTRTKGPRNRRSRSPRQSGRSKRNRDARRSLRDKPRETCVSSRGTFPSDSRHLTSNPSSSLSDHPIRSGLWTPVESTGLLKPEMVVLLALRHEGSERSEPKDLSQMPNKPHIAPNLFSFTHFPKNASATPLESHTFKTKDLKPFRFTHLQKVVGGPSVWQRLSSRLP